ncbi:hypothetical protein BST61_g1965 [Cercospora zeina]
MKQNSCFIALISDMMSFQRPAKLLRIPANPNQTHNTQRVIMSAPNQGRQSPEPERQTGAQQKDVPASDVNNQGKNQPGQQAAEQSKDQLKNLGSNPGGPLDKAAEEKTKHS